MEMYTERFYDWLVGYLDGCDPIELIAHGALPREYEPAARDIIQLLPSLPDPETAAKAIYAALLDGYGNSKEVVGEVERYRELAGHVLFAWQRRTDLFRSMGLNSEPKDD